MTEEPYDIEHQQMVTRWFRPRPTEQDFRNCGFTKDAINYPLSARAVAALAHINGMTYENYVKISPAVFYAPCKISQDRTERRGEAHEQGRLIKDHEGRWVIT